MMNIITRNVNARPCKEPGVSFWTDRISLSEPISLQVLELLVVTGV